MSNQPDWECIGQLGDMNPTEHGGLWVFRDKTGVYCEEAEYLTVYEDGRTGRTRGTAYRFILERCTWTPKLFEMGVLSDNKYHPDHAAWWASPEGEKKNRPQDSTYLSGIASFIGVELDELRKMFCSEDALLRARAYEAVGSYHGFHELDNDPLELTKTEIRQRYETRGGNPKPRYKASS